MFSYLHRLYGHLFADRIRFQSFVNGFRGRKNGLLADTGYGTFRNFRRRRRNSRRGRPSRRYQINTTSDENSHSRFTDLRQRKPRCLPGIFAGEEDDSFSNFTRDLRRRRSSRYGRGIFDYTGYDTFKISHKRFTYNNDRIYIPDAAISPMLDTAPFRTWR